LQIEKLDQDGALQETYAAAMGDTRGDFLRKAALGGGAVLTSGAFMGMLPEVAGAKPSKKRDVEILNFALTLEFLEAAFYEEAIEKGALNGSVLAFARLLADHEATHATALRQTIKKLGKKPVKKPEFDFQGTTEDQGRFLETSFTLENTGVHAYVGQAARLKSKSLLATAASIATIEGRHAAAVAVLIGEAAFDAAGNSVTPDGAFDRGFSKKRILKIVGKTNFIES